MPPKLVAIVETPDVAIGTPKDVEGSYYYQELALIGGYVFFLGGLGCFFLFVIFQIFMTHQDKEKSRPYE